MSSVQAWVMQLCIVCVLISVILSFVKNDKINNSIKTVLALYILITAVIPLTNGSVKPVQFDISAPQSAELIDSSILIKKNAEQMLMDEINNRFKEKNISAVCIKLELNDALSEAEKIKVSIDNKLETSRILEVLKEFTGEKTEVITEKEG